MDDDERRYGDTETRQEAWEQRRARRRRYCECGDDLPGHCLGQDSCPYASHEKEEECPV